MINAIIIDDETRSRQIIKEMLTRYCSDIEVISDVSSGEEAYPVIIERCPDLVFLDIEMPYEDGFDFLKRFDRIPFEIVFITAYNQYAIQAIKICALDYLLKPLSITDLKTTVERAKERISSKHSQGQYELLLQNIKRDRNAEHHKLAVPARDGLEFIDIRDIILLEADGAYTSIRMTEDRKLLSTRNLKEYEEFLPESLFFRAHHSFIINLQHIRNYHKGEGGYVVMADHSNVDISKRKKKEFLDRVGLSKL